LNTLSESQQKTLDLMLREPTLNTKQLSDKLNVCARTIRKHKAKIRRLSETGQLPEYFRAPAPPGHIIHGTSTLVEGQWIKTSLIEDTRLELIKTYIDGVVSEKSFPKVKAPKKVDNDWVNALVIADLHLGLEVYPENGGKTWNIDIAKRAIAESVNQILEYCPPAPECWLVNLGDWTHANDYKRATPQSGHLLDQDGPFYRTQLAAGQLLKWVIFKALSKHKKIRVINIPGNHDFDSAGWLDMMVDCAFENDKRIILNEREGNNHHLLHGSNYINVCHGDKPRGANNARDIGDMMVNHDFWHQSKHRQLWTGHVHSEHLKTLRNGIKARTFSTPVPPDEYAYTQGYTTNQTIYRVSLNKEGRQITDSVTVPLLDSK